MADIPGDGSTGVTLTLGIPVNGVIDLDGDHDWYRIELVAGQKYTFTLTGNGPTPLSDPYLRLRDAGGTELALDGRPPPRRSAAKLVALKSRLSSIRRHRFRRSTTWIRSPTSSKRLTGVRATNIGSTLLRAARSPSM